MEYTAVATSSGRFDKVAAAVFAKYSRTRLRRWIESGELRVDAKIKPPDFKLHGGEQLTLTAKAELEQAADLPWSAAEVPVTILHEDPDFILVGKPVGLVIHPGAGHSRDTLINGLLHQYPELLDVPRSGVVHRLDKDTSGLLLVARTCAAYEALTAMLKNRLISRSYLMLIKGRLVQAETISAPIGRHPFRRTQMAVVATGKPAVTHVRPLRLYASYTWAEAVLETGRTHQIRVHMKHCGYPVVGDPIYGSRPRRRPQCNHLAGNAHANTFSHQALHAAKLAFKHPINGNELSFATNIPEELERLLQRLAST